MCFNILSHIALIPLVLCVAARKPRKKPKPLQNVVTPTTTTTTTTTTVHGPIPKPYLALAPSPITSISIPAPRPSPSASRSTLVLPSNYKKSNQSSSSLAPSAPSHVTPFNSRNGYGAGLLAPPTIVPGGQAAQPRTLGGVEAPTNGRRRSAERAGIGGRRSEERLRDLGTANPSMTSLGQLGQILESDHMPDERNVMAPALQRRRRRIVREETAGLTRTPTVSTREEGRALGLARGASMRRLNVWDG